MVYVFCILRKCISLHKAFQRHILCVIMHVLLFKNKGRNKEHATRYPGLTLMASKNAG